MRMMMMSTSTCSALLVDDASNSKGAAEFGFSGSEGANIAEFHHHPRLE